MFQYAFTPLHRQFDDGFGAVGESFKEAADRLSSDRKDGNPAFLNSHLPINFLYRHAIELFLKGMIITLHRRLHLPSGDDPHTPEPLIPVSGKWKAIYQVHGIADLYEFFKSIVTQHVAAVRQIANTDWSDIPAELDEWITTIHDADDGSTFFRYPVTKNQEGDVAKSSVQEITLEETLASIRNGVKPAKVYIIVDDDNDNVIDMYQMTHEPMSHLSVALKGTVDLLSLAHFGLTAELVCGYGKAT
jgi:hypothetical protein